MSNELNQTRLEDNYTITKTKEQLMTADNAVMEILRTDFRARNDDKWLWYRYVRDIQLIDLYLPFERFKDIVPFETITRVRRKIQHDRKLFLPTDKAILRRRFAREIAFKEYSKEE